MAIDMDKLHAFLGTAIVDFGATFNAALVRIGDKLGLYKGLAAGGPQTAAELAKRTGTAERYVREWLSCQAAGGYVTYDPASAKFHLSEEQAFAMADENSPVFLPGAFQVALAAAKSEEELTERFKTGKGMGWHEHNPELFVGTERFFRPGYAANLISTWIPALEGVKEKLERALGEHPRYVEAVLLHAVCLGQRGDRAGSAEALGRALALGYELPSGLAALPPVEVSFNYLGALDHALPAGSLFGPGGEGSGPLRSPGAPGFHDVADDWLAGEPLLDGIEQAAHRLPECRIDASSVEFRRHARCRTGAEPGQRPSRHQRGEHAQPIAAGCLGCSLTGDAAEEPDRCSRGAKRRPRHKAGPGRHPHAPERRRRLIFRHPGRVEYPGPRLMPEPDALLDLLQFGADVAPHQTERIGDRVGQIGHPAHAHRHQGAPHVARRHGWA